MLVDSYPYTPKVIQDAIEIWIVDTETRGYGKVMELSLIHISEPTRPY